MASRRSAPRNSAGGTNRRSAPQDSTHRKSAPQDSTKCHVHMHTWSHLVIMFQLLFYSEGVTLSTLLRSHRFQNLPSNPNESQRIIIRRKHVWEDALHQLKCGFDVHKHPKVTFVGEPAVDDGGPRREFFHLLIQPPLSQQLS